MQFQTRYSHSKTPPEINSGISLVEKAGYIPAKARIENMIMAGQRLIEHRASLYDSDNFKDGSIPDDYIDPTRSKNFDMADASIFKQNIENNIQQRELLKASEAAPKPSEEVLKQSETPE